MLSAIGDNDMAVIMLVELAVWNCAYTYSSYSRGIPLNSAHETAG